MKPEINDIQISVDLNDCVTAGKWVRSVRKTVCRSNTALRALESYSESKDFTIFK